MILQLNPSIPLDTSKGRGEAHFILDYGKEDDIIWGVFLDSNGECWWVPNNEVKAIPNYSIKRRFSLDKPVDQNHKL